MKFLIGVGEYPLILWFYNLRIINCFYPLSKVILLIVLRLGLDQLGTKLDFLSRNLKQLYFK